MMVWTVHEMRPVVRPCQVTLVTARTALSSLMATENLLRSEAELELDLVSKLSLHWAPKRKLTPFNWDLQARKQKAQKYKVVGEPISTPGVPIDIKIRGNYAWVAGSAHTAGKIDLQVRSNPIFRV